MGTLIGSAELDLGAAFDKQLATSADAGFDQCVTPPQSDLTSALRPPNSEEGTA